MPFTPLPTSLLEQFAFLETQSSVQVLDLGSGQGGFSRLLEGFDVQIRGLDRLPFQAGIPAGIRGDALAPPIQAHSLDCILAGNLVRHLLAQDHRGAFLPTWLDLLKPGGKVFILEDEPGSTDPAVQNFQDVQAFLADLIPSSRGPLLSLADFKDLAKRVAPGQPWESGIQLNDCLPDADAVCEFLAGDDSGPRPGGQAGRLIDSIVRHGLSYGSYWWAAALVD